VASSSHAAGTLTGGMRAVAATVIVGALLLLFALLPASPAAAETYAPVNQADPALSVPEAQLKAALSCPAGLGAGGREPVLLVPGTSLNPQAEYSWNWEPALAKLGWPYCTVELPGNAMEDIQTAGEYVVYAIRTMHQLSGRKVQILGHSQGGMVPRWALRFWPSTRAMVDDVVGLAPSNHGTQDSEYCSTATPCPPAFWQQRSSAAFIRALNSRAETFAGVAYTNVYTHADEVVVPNGDNSGSSSLHGSDGQITNVALQDICPADLSEHLAIGTYDPVAYALAIDALSNPGPAKPSRLDPSTCSQALMPGVDPSTFASDYLGELTFLGGVIASSPTTPAEPPLACYVTASCAPTGARLKLRVRPRRAELGSRRRYRVKVTLISSTGRGPAAGAKVSVGGRHRRTNAHGRARFRLRFLTAGRHLLHASLPGARGARAAVRVRTP
jgi:triacylglycerol esterase/lipase EstA (alpha/beta hydrolase family)